MDVENMVYINAREIVTTIVTYSFVVVCPERCRCTTRHIPSHDELYRKDDTFLGDQNIGVGTGNNMIRNNVTRSIEPP